MFTKLKEMPKEFPKPFWILIFSTFIDRLGGFLLFPFFSIYLLKKFDTTATEIGLLFMAISVGSLLGSFIGGALTDKIGRKVVILFGLVVSGLGSIAMGLVNDLKVFYILAVLLGLLGDVAGPARQAMIPDLLPASKQSQGFGILRVAVNIAATVGPILGGFLATRSYMFLFVADAVSSIITAFIVYFAIPETKPQAIDEQTGLPDTSNDHDPSFGETLKGYWQVMKDGTFMVYIFISAIMILVYMQMYSTLSIYLARERAFTPELIGALMSVNAFLVVALQFFITRVCEKYPALYVMAAGTLCFGLGFGLIGFVTQTYAIFLAMAVVTIGEMIVLPTSNGVVGRLAPIDKRGRYMAIFGFSWAVPNLFGTLLAGLVMDNINPNWVWWACFLLSMVALAGFLLLHKSKQERFAVAKEAQKDSTDEETAEPVAQVTLEPTSTTDVCVD